MEKPMWARKRKLDTDKVDLKPPFKETGWQGVHREVESEGHEEKYRAVIDGGYPEDEPVGQRWRQVEPALWRQRRFSFAPPNQGVCGQHGTEERRVTSGELAKFAGGTAISEPISASEGASEAASVVRQPE